MPKFLVELIKSAVRLVYRGCEVHGEENLPDGPYVAVGNHCQVHGPIVSQLYLPPGGKTWCAGEMMHAKEIPSYSYRDFWSKKPAGVRWIFRICSYLIVPLAVLVFNNTEVIGVYHDRRILNTFRESVDWLKNGGYLVIFPECNDEKNAIIHRFQDGYADVGKMYGKKTGEKLMFVPMYTAPELRQVWFGKPEAYDLEKPGPEERKRVNEVMMERVTELGRSLPPHRVVPYPNVPRKKYPMNTDPLP